MIDLSEIWDAYKARAAAGLARPDWRFDPRVYAEVCDDPAMAGADAATLRRHYETVGKSHGLPPTAYDRLQRDFPQIDAALLRSVTDPALLAAMQRGEAEAFRIGFELMRLGDPVDGLMSVISAPVYLRTHPDVAKAGLHPVDHWLLYGIAEGRRTLADVRRGVATGGKTRSSLRPICLVALHEMSKTGAPIVGLDIIRKAAETHDVIVVALRGGALFDDIRDHAVKVVITETPAIDLEVSLGDDLSKVAFAILNSVETADFLPVLVAHRIPVATYLHEYPAYAWPLHTPSWLVWFSDIMLFSATEIRNAWQGHFCDCGFDVGRDSFILPQRDLVVGQPDAKARMAARARLSRVLGRDLAECRLICAAGQMQWRKGTDLFVSTAQVCRDLDETTVFLWIGDGFDPEDRGFGVWMRHHLEQAGANRIDGNLFTLPAGPLYTDVMTAADAFFLPSRMDPLPNVVFDAVAGGCPVVLFRGGSGFDDPVYLNLPVFTAVEYGNPLAAARALLQVAPARTAGADAPMRPDDLFTFIQDRLQARLSRHRHFLRGPTPIDVPVLYSDDAQHAAQRQAERERLFTLDRRVLWRDLTQVRQTLTQSGHPVHRRCRVARIAEAPALTSAPPGFSVHLHVAALDSLEHDLATVGVFRQADRLVITADSRLLAEQVRSVLSRLRLQADLRVVPNGGSDVLPFLDLIPADTTAGAAGADDLWLHLHLPEVPEQATAPGPVPARSLTGILGSDDQARAALAWFAADPALGLIAPLDPFVRSWGMTRPLLAQYAAILPDDLPENPLLAPTGQLFWVRRPVVAAMKGMFGPAFPWPRDGFSTESSVYGLITRLWPTATAMAGYDALFLLR